MKINKPNFSEIKEFEKYADLQKNMLRQRQHEIPNLCYLSPPPF